MSEISGYKKITETKKENTMNQIEQDENVIDATAVTVNENTSNVYGESADTYPDNNDIITGSSKSLEEKNDKTSYLSKKDMSNLRYNKYEEVAKKYNTSYVLLNKKTGVIVEMKAASSYHACNIIGWRPKNCILLQTKIEVSNNVSNTTTETISEVLEAPKNTEIVV